MQEDGMHLILVHPFITNKNNYYFNTVKIDDRKHLQKNRFLGTYSVDPSIQNTITIDSYISSFVTLTLLMGVVFQLPVVAYFLGKTGLIDAAMLAGYRRHAMMVIAVVAAVITPPDVVSLVLVAVPLYLLYEVSIQIVRHTGSQLRYYEP